MNHFGQGITVPKKMSNKTREFLIKLKVKMSAKTRMHLTLRQKHQILKQIDDHPKWTRNQLCEWAKIEFKLPRPPTRSTITRIVRRRDDIANCEIDVPPASCKLPNRPKDLIHDERLWRWFREREQNNIAISGPLLQEKSRSLNHACELTFSLGWLTRFKDRHGIRNYVLHGEDAVVNAEVAEEAKKELFMVTSKYALCDIYNCDESGFFWGAMPNQSSATKPRNGHKKNKSRITALCGWN